MPVHAARAEPPPEHGEPDPDDEEPREEREPRIELLGDEEPRKEERHESQPEHAGGVGHGDRRAEEDRVPGAPAGPHEIAGDERLAVAGSQRVRGAPERRHEERDERDSHGQLSALYQRLEAAADMDASRPRPEPRCCSGDRSRHKAGSGRAHLEGRREELSRVGTELVRAALGRHRRHDEPCTVPSPDRHLAPADPVGVGSVGERQPPAVRRSSVHRFEAKRGQAPRPLPLRDAVREQLERRADAVELQLERPGELGRVAGGADAVSGLEGRDLGEVEDVVDEDTVARELDAGVVVDGEVAERVRARAARAGECRERGDDEQRRDERTQPHLSVSRATGAHRTENSGLSASALPYHRRIAARSPAQPAA